MIDKVYQTDITNGQSQKKSIAIRYISLDRFADQNIVALWNQENVISTGTYVWEDKSERIVYSSMNSSQLKQQTKQNQLILKRQDVVLRLQNLIEELSQLNILEACEYLFRKLSEICHQQKVLVATSRAKFRMEAIASQSGISMKIQMKCYLKDDCEAIILIF